ncbi:MAG TPA: BON domain-containing protein [Acidimicrobiales bacterium]|jgi:osmotically-inducible protein OsmY
MTDDAGGTPAPYLVQHIQDALAADDRTRELGVDATVAGRRVVLTGTVATEPLRRAIVAVVAELVPDHQVVNGLAVVPADEGGDVEELP